MGHFLSGDENHRGCHNLCQDGRKYPEGKTRRSAHPLHHLDFCIEMQDSTKNTMRDLMYSMSNMPCLEKKNIHLQLSLDRLIEDQTEIFPRDMERFLSRLNSWGKTEVSPKYCTTRPWSSSKDIAMPTTGLGALSALIALLQVPWPG